jgi:hypothetical protein
MWTVQHCLYFLYSDFQCSYTPESEFSSNSWIVVRTQNCSSLLNFLNCAIKVLQ